MPTREYLAELRRAFREARITSIADVRRAYRERSLDDGRGPWEGHMSSVVSDTRRC